MDEMLRLSDVTLDGTGSDFLKDEIMTVGDLMLNEVTQQGDVTMDETRRDLLTDELKTGNTTTTTTKTTRTTTATTATTTSTTTTSTTTTSTESDFPTGERLMTGDSVPDEMMNGGNTTRDESLTGETIATTAKTTTTTTITTTRTTTITSATTTSTTTMATRTTTPATKTTTTATQDGTVSDPLADEVVNTGNIMVIVRGDTMSPWRETTSSSQTGATMRAPNRPPPSPCRWLTALSSGSSRTKLARWRTWSPYGLR